MNMKNLNYSFERMNNSIEAGKQLMSLMGEKREFIKQYNTDSLIFYTFESPKFTPSENVVADLLQSGRLQLVRSEQLRDLLFAWSSKLFVVEEEYDDLTTHTENHMTTFLNENYALRDIDMYGQLNWKSPSKIPIDKLAIFSNIKYENLVDDMLYKQLNYIKALREIEVILKSILEETKN